MKLTLVHLHPPLVLPLCKWFTIVPKVFKIYKVAQRYQHQELVSKMLNQILIPILITGMLVTGSMFCDILHS